MWVVFRWRKLVGEGVMCVWILLKVEFIELLEWRGCVVGCW